MIITPFRTYCLASESFWFLFPWFNNESTYALKASKFVHLGIFWHIQNTILALNNKKQKIQIEFLKKTIIILHTFFFLFFQEKNTTWKIWVFLIRFLYPYMPASITWKQLHIENRNIFFINLLKIPFSLAMSRNRWLIDMLSPPEIPLNAYQKFQ